MLNDFESDDRLLRGYEKLTDALLFCIVPSLLGKECCVMLNLAPKRKEKMRLFSENEIQAAGYLENVFFLLRRPA